MYEHEEYERLIERISRRPVEPVIGHTAFVALLAIALFARTVLSVEYVGLAVLLLLFLYPYYLVQLLMRSRMRRHQARLRAYGAKPIYVPSSPRGWAAVYIGFFLAVSVVVIAVEKVLSQWMA